MSHKATTSLTLTHNLADDARQQLEPWLEEAGTLARAECSEHDFFGALTVVAIDRVWADYCQKLYVLAIHDSTLLLTVLW
jgi:hypothetical protein